jgi:hypothetical protein
MLEIFCAKMDYYISGKVLVHLIVIMLLQSLQKKITDQYRQIWLTEIKSNNKLETYVFLKNEFIKENYIGILKEKHLIRAMS